jgi:LmbE family N-acetylglucosaminyl deacetylase
MAETVAVSPHLDDAAFAVSSKLDAGDATVVTVFTAVPDASRPTSVWDQLTSATSSHYRQRERRDEDAQAMRLLDARSIYLEELELLYRDTPLNLSAAIDRLAECFVGAGEVLLPMAIGGHPDHQITREIGLRAAARCGRPEVLLYADYPYIVQYGWPPSLTGRPPLPYLDVDFWLTDQLTKTGLDPSSLKPELVRLSEAQRIRKREVIAAYRSQAHALLLGPADLAADPAKLDYELWWRTAVPRCQ